jgi:hypothetical protein
VKSCKTLHATLLLGLLALPAAAAGTAPAAGHDFAVEARLMYRVVACAGEGALPTGVDAAVVAEHCAALKPRIEGYRRNYLAKAAPFLAALRPKGLPSTVVYPAGGGDLLSALTTYPDATEITTLSLELAGDPRRLAGLGSADLKQSLELIRQTVGPLLSQNDSTSENLQKGQRGNIPGQVAFFMIGLAVHGYEPVGLRYFRLEDDGRVHYLDLPEIAALDSKAAAKLKHDWAPPDFSPAFANVELTFRAKDGPIRVHRHFGANLADGPLTKAPGLLKHLEAKGRIVAMTKAASYLLWRADFSKMRQYLLAHMDFMVSDSTGVPPADAKAAGYAMDAYGEFSGSFLEASKAINDQFRELWSSKPAKPLPFRYGYLDAGRRFHMVVTHRP